LSYEEKLPLSRVLEADMAQYRKPLLPLACMCLTLLTGTPFLKPLECKAGTSAIDFYNPGKFEPLPLPANIPKFTVTDQRSSDDIFINIKRKMMPVDEYFRNGIDKFIANSSGNVVDDGRTLQFIITDFRIELKRTTPRMRDDKGEIITKIYVDVFLDKNGTLTKLDSYDSISWNEYERISDGISTLDIQYVLDLNFDKLIKKIFSDQELLAAIR
jgi:hypothetical protein